MEELKEVGAPVIVGILPGLMLIGSAVGWQWSWSTFGPAMAAISYMFVGAFSRRVTQNRLLRALGSFSLPVAISTLHMSIWMAETKSKSSLLLTLHHDDPLSVVVTVVVGGGILAFGLVWLIWTNVLFVIEGNGTLSPIDPPSNLVVTGPYRYVRNPMIAGVLLILVGMTLMAGGPLRMVVYPSWFFTFKTLYFVLEEEPTLRRRFGKEYDVYCQEVHRWIPRLKPYVPKQKK